MLFSKLSKLMIKRLILADSRNHESGIHTLCQMKGVSTSQDMYKICPARVVFTARTQHRSRVIGVPIALVCLFELCEEKSDEWELRS